MKILLWIRSLCNHFFVFLRRLFTGKRSWLFIALAAFVLIGCVFFYEWINNEKQDTWSYVYTALKLYNPSNLKGPNSHNWAYLWMGLVATLLIPFLTAATQTFIGNLVNRRRTGRSIDHFMCNHYVLIGYNIFATQILEQVLKGNRSYAVIMTSQNPIELREKIENELKVSIARRVIIYAGDAVAKDKIKDLNLLYARKLYLLDESDTSNSQYTRNLIILQKIVSAVTKRKNPLEVYLQVNNSQAYNLLQRVDIPNDFFKNEKGKTVVDFHPFNFYENWARLLWSYHKLPQYDVLDFEPMEEENRHVHLVISEFNSMGRALFFEALRLCHYPNFDTETKNNRTIITVFDKKWKEKKDMFLAQYPYLGQISDIDCQYFDVDITSEKARQMIDDWAENDRQERLLTIAICEKDPDTAMIKGLNLPEKVYRNKTRILVRQELGMENNEIFAYENNRAYPFLQFFGMLESGLDMRQLDDRLAICINGIYNLYNGTPVNLSDIEKFSACLKNIQDTLTKKNEAEWKTKWIEKTIQSDKWSSRFQADMFKTYIAIWERHKGLSADEFEKWQEILAEMEHRRWIAERTVNGFRKANEGENKDKIMKIHDDMREYRELDKNTKNYDRNVVNTAPMLVDELNKMID